MRLARLGRDLDDREVGRAARVDPAGASARPLVPAPVRCRGRPPAAGSRRRGTRRSGRRARRRARTGRRATATPCRSRSGTGSRRSARRASATRARVRPRSVAPAPDLAADGGRAPGRRRRRWAGSDGHDVGSPQTDVDNGSRRVVWLCYQQISLDNSKQSSGTTDPGGSIAMQIAIIGAGNVGRALASSLTRAGHDVTITRRASRAHAAEAASQTGATAGTSNSDAAARRPGRRPGRSRPVDRPDRRRASARASTARSSSTSRTGPTPTPDGARDLDRRGAPGRSCPSAHVVKAFNTAFASRQANPTVGGIAPDGFVAGDDATRQADRPRSSSSRSASARSMPGSLASARTLEGMAWLNIQRNLAGGTWQDAWVLVGPETVSRGERRQPQLTAATRS